MFWMLLAGAAGAAEPAVSAVSVIPFEGLVDFKAQELSLLFGGSASDRSLTVNITRSSDSRYDLKADIRHVGTPAWDVAAELQAHIELLGSSPRHRELAGEVMTRYTLLNYKPVRDAYMKFAVRERRLIVDPFWVGAFSGRGGVDLAGQKQMDLSLELMSADLDEFWEMLRTRGFDVPDVSGIVSSTLLLKGPLARPEVNGRISAYNGRLKDLGYDSMDIRFQGTYPLLRLEEGRVDSSNGPSFRVSGALDISDFSRFGTQLRLLNKELIVMDGKDSRSWAFKRIDAAGAQTTQLRSFIRGGADGRDSEDGVIGLEKRIGF